MIVTRFKIDVHQKKDGTNAVDRTTNTIGSPHAFKDADPNFFKRWGIKQSSIEHG